MTKRRQLEEQIQSLESKLKAFPEGDIICARNQNYYKWYYSDGNITAYLPKKERKFAEQLAAKKYLSFMLRDLRHEKQALDAYLEHYDSKELQEAQMLMDMPAYKELLAPFFKPLSQELLCWANSDYQRNPKYPEQLIHRTLSGHYVRSKSEALIDMALYVAKIPFRYECQLSFGNLSIYPDFTIRHPHTGKVYYWEHFGLMDHPPYRKTVCSKLELYISHGIIPSIQLITTYETKENPLSSDKIEHIVREYFA